MKFKDMDQLRAFVLDEYQKKVCRSHESWSAGYMSALYLVLSKMKELPEIEAEEVVHGHWIEECTDLVCSACGAVFKDEISFMLPHGMQYPQGCPACRAKMDLGVIFNAPSK